MLKILNSVDRSVEYILIFLMAFMVLDVSWQVFTRFILADPSSYTEEIARFLLIWIGILGANYAFRKKVHLGIDIVTDRLQGGRKFIVEIVTHSLSFVFAFFVMVVGGFYLVGLTLELNQMSAAMGIRMGYIYTVLPLSGFLIMVYAALFIINTIWTMRGRPAFYQS